MCTRIKCWRRSRWYRPFQSLSLIHYSLSGAIVGTGTGAAVVILLLLCVTVPVVITYCAMKKKMKSHYIEEMDGR